MATLAELFEIISLTASGAQDLRNKVIAQGLELASVVLKSEDTTDPPYDQTAGKHDDRVRLAAQIAQGNAVVQEALFRLAVMDNTSATQSQITGASDTAIRSALESTIDDLALATKFLQTDT